MTLIKKIIFEKKNFSNQEKEIVSQFKKYGIVVIKDFFKKKKDILWEKYNRDLKRIDTIITNKKKINYKDLKTLRKKNPDLLGKLAALGSKPNNIISGIMLKNHPSILKLVQKLLNSSILGTMNFSDRLFFESGNNYEKKFFQDIHNDYDYVFQSKKALTAHICLKGSGATGGVNFWLKSHKLKLKVKKDKNGRPQIIPRDLRKLNHCDKIFIKHDPGTITFFDTMLFHCAVQNTSENVRKVQIFRYSDLKYLEV